LPRPLVISVHDVLPHVPRLGARLEHAMLHRLYNLPDGIVVHHASVAQDLTEQFRVPTSRVHVVEYPVLTDAAGPPPDGPATILVFGALRPNKGLAVMDLAMQLLRDDDIRLVIAGRGHRELEGQALEMQARDPRIRAEIGFISAERKAELFKECRIVALPYTTFTSQSAVLQDAYGYGRPVVVSDVGALGHSVRADGGGRVVQPSDPRELADAVRELARPAAWDPAAAACREVAARRSPERFGHQLRDVYERVIG
jgi:glycosyltransferase involved in cell wall biosynthesis